jgi:hypothetical protein
MFVHANPAIPIIGGIAGSVQRVVVPLNHPITAYPTMKNEENTQTKSLAPAVVFSGPVIVVMPHPGRQHFPNPSSAQHRCNTGKKNAIQGRSMEPSTTAAGAQDRTDPSLRVEGIRLAYQKQYGER